MIKTSKFGTRYLHKQIEQDPALPFVTTVLGQEVTVARFETIKRDRIVAPCKTGEIDPPFAVPVAR